MLLSTGTKDPRLKNVVITDVIVSRDLTSARVFFSVEEDEHKKVAQLLNKAGGFFRSCLLYTSPSPRDGLLSRMPSSA